MARIEFDHVGVAFPIFNASARSLRDRLLQVATGGKLGTDPHGYVIVKALEELSCTFSDGDRIGVVGHNGSGKTTLLRLINGVFKPSSGTAHIEGRVNSLLDISLGIDSEATGRENIQLRGTLLGLSRRQILEQMDEIIEFSEIGNFVDLPLRTYSSGMHMRLAFAVSTIIQPEILLMDEWLSVGDQGFRIKAEKRIKELVEGTSILVIASHSRELIHRVCNRVVWLEHGRLKQIGNAKEVLDAYFGTEDSGSRY